MRTASYVAAIVATFIGFTLLTPTPANAGWRLDRAQAIANIVWDAPCGGHPTITWVALGDSGVAANADPDACLIRFDVNHKTVWPEFCTRLIHEFGHLARYRDPLNVSDPGHSHNPRSVMFHISYGLIAAKDTVSGRQVTRPVADARCRDRGRAYLRAHDGLISG
jgi:hypothetical protein